jgi:carbonic anhydrase
VINNIKYSRAINSIALSLIVSLTTTFSVNAADTQVAKKWSYQGETGPENWSKLSKDYLACNNGKNQSPVNITKTVDGKLPGIPYNYNILVADKIINNGHTIQVDIRSGGEIKVDGKEYKLKQFHFHTPSENTIKGKAFPLEIHFVHASEEGKLTVIAIMYTLGSPDPLLETLWRQMPVKIGQSKRLAAKTLSVLETDTKLKQYIRFNGSLTTPPCTEGVIWLVKKPYLTVSRQQLEYLRTILKQPNNRPVQATNARIIVD